MAAKAGLFTDIGFVRGADGIYDLDVDLDSGDFGLIDGLESALMVSLFSDRRAASDEVGDPMLRRGWIGDLVSDRPDDRHGSGIWLYEMRKLTDGTEIGIRLEAERALRWLVEDGLVATVAVKTRSAAAIRAIWIDVTLGLVGGRASTYSYPVAAATSSRVLTNASV